MDRCTTLRRLGASAVFSCLVAVAGAAFVLNSARTGNGPYRASYDVLASAGHAATAQMNRGCLRTEQARQRTTSPGACIAVSADSIGRDSGRRSPLLEFHALARLNPVRVESGRSPPTARS